MNSSCFQRLSILLVLLAIALPTFQREWQGTGNLNATLMAEIRAGINSGTITSSTSATSIDGIAQNISTRLNQLWDPAWNVIITKSVTTMDTVLYGYAFNDHWMWICGNFIPMTIGDSVDYIIWKDYNCQNWATLSDLNTAGTGFTSDQQRSLTSYTFARVDSNVWLEAHDFVEYANSQLPGAYSVAMSQYASTKFYGYICLVSTNFFRKNNVFDQGNGVYGSYFLFNTR